MNGMDTSIRLAELIERFEASSVAKQASNPNPRLAKIRYQPAWWAWGSWSPVAGLERDREQRGAFGYHRWRQRWTIVYVRKHDPNDVQWGAVIGHSRAGTILWLLRHFKQWGSQ